MDKFNELSRGGSAVVLVTHDKRIIEQADRILMLEDGSLVPPAERIMQDVSSSLQTLMEVDPARLGRMMSFGLALARVALADGRADPRLPAHGGQYGGRNGPEPEQRGVPGSG